MTDRFAAMADAEVRAYLTAAIPRIAMHAAGNSQHTGHDFISSAERLLTGGEPYGYSDIRKLARAIEDRYPACWEGRPGEVRHMFVIGQPTCLCGERNADHRLRSI